MIAFRLLHIDEIEQGKYYIMFENVRKDIDLIISFILTLLCIAFVLVPPLKETPIRLFFGIPLMLFLPGYSLITTLFPRKDDLDGVERVALSFLLSIAIIPLLGLLLNYTPFGIRLAAVLIILSTFTMSLSLTAWFRRLKLPAEERFRFPFDNLLKVNLGQSFLNKCLSIILIASIIGSSTTLVYVAMKPRIGERFTEFYLLGPNGITSDYPIDLKVGEEGKMIIGIVNHEYENVTYRLEIIFNGFLVHEEQFSLAENEKLENFFKFKAIEKEINQKLEFILYKEQRSENYRTLHLWVSVT